MTWELCLPQEKPLSTEDSAEISEKQTQRIIMWVAELQHKLNSQPHIILSEKVKVLIRKKWDS